MVWSTNLSVIVSESVTNTLVSWATCSHQCLSQSALERVTGLDRSVSNPGPRVVRIN